MDGVVCFKDRLVIPMALMEGVLAGIHAAHQGVTGMVGRIDETVFWPSIHTDIVRTRGGCMTCIREAPSQPAGFPIAPQANNFLVVADRFSGWQQVYPEPPGKILVENS